MSTSPSRAADVATIEAHGVVAVFRRAPPSGLRPLIDALVAGDVRVIEITMTMPGALDALSALRASLPEDVLLGAGTVLDAETARLAVLAGARFVVAPTFSSDVLSLCHRYDVVGVPGACTPTEILTAWDAGADLVKIFPAGRLGPEYVKEIREPLPRVRLLASGGVTLENAAAFVSAGAVAVGLGSALLESEAAVRGDYGAITARVRRLMQAIRAVREASP